MSTGTGFHGYGYGYGWVTQGLPVTFPTGNNAKSIPWNDAESIPVEWHKVNSTASWTSEIGCIHLFVLFVSICSVPTTTLSPFLSPKDLTLHRSNFDFASVITQLWLCIGWCHKSCNSKNYNGYRVCEFLLLLSEFRLGDKGRNLYYIDIYLLIGIS